MKKLLEEFKTFALKGNVLDMAVGVVVGGAFTSIVNSLVADVLTPIISLVTPGMDFSEFCQLIAERGVKAAANSFRFHHLAEMNVGKRGAQCFPCNRELRVTVGIRAHTKQTMVFVHNIYCINGANV